MAKRSRQEKKSKVANNSKKTPQEKVKLSPQAKADALHIVNDVSKPSFNKQQRKEVQQAIELGIERYRREHKAKARDVDKLLKKAKSAAVIETAPAKDAKNDYSGKLAWGLLILSWVAFLVMYLM